MKRSIYSKWIWWALFVSGSFLVAGLTSGFAAWCLHRWHLPVAGFCAAAAVVATGYLAAPSFKLQAGRAVFAVGAFAAWVILEPSWFPESYGDKAYQPTHLPLMATYCGGVLGLLVAAILGKARDALKQRVGKTSAS